MIVFGGFFYVGLSIYIGCKLIANAILVVNDYDDGPPDDGERK